MFCAHVARIICSLSASSTGGRFDTTEDSYEDTEDSNEDSEDSEEGTGDVLEMSRSFLRFVRMARN